MNVNVNQDCVFCQIINQQLPSYKIFENEYVYAFLDVFPTSDGHTLVIPKKHVNNLMECDDTYLTEVIKATKLVSNELKTALNPKGFNYVSNLGKEAYQVVMHFHIHIIPKYNQGHGYLLGRNTSKNKPVKDVYHKIAQTLNPQS